MTSYPDRFGTLPLTLQSLLTQSVVPDRLILWIAHADGAELPHEVLRLKSEGLEVRFCEDIRSYKKLVPTLRSAPDAFVVSADDDLYYWPTWLKELTDAYSGNDKEVVCHRAHKITLSTTGLPRPYKEWEYETDSVISSDLIFPTSGAGAMYPPHIFHSDVFDIGVFLASCPHADDVWWYWMVRRNGGAFRKIGLSRGPVALCKRPKYSLHVDNVSGGGNDRQIRALIDIYGF